MRHNFGLVRYTFSPAGLRVGASAALAILLPGQAATAQDFRMPGTLRYGSGLLDIPVAWVLPHMAITGTYSGFSVSVDEPVLVKPDGTELTGKFGDPVSKWVSDGAIAIGLMNRVELGASIQHFDSQENGGNMLGGFARISLLPASMERLALAAGARFVTSPSYGADSDYGPLQPGRLGYPDYRLLETPSNDEIEGMSSSLSPYVVATARAMSSESMDVTVTGGWGMGMFSSGSDYAFYSETGTGGVFGGAAAHFKMGGGRILNVMAEHNGFDLNAGVQLDLGNIRVGGFMHGLMGDGSSTYRASKFGVLASLSFPNRTDTVITRDTMVAADTVVTRDTVTTADTTITTHTLADADRATLEEMILFAFDRSEITDEAQAGLMAKVGIMNGDPGITLLIEGHADERGNPDYNTRLGQRRADAVLEFLTGEDHGLDSARFSVESRGEDDPLDPAPTPVGEPSPKPQGRLHRHRVHRIGGYVHRRDAHDQRYGSRHGDDDHHRDGNGPDAAHHREGGYGQHRDAHGRHQLGDQREDRYRRRRDQRSRDRGARTRPGRRCPGRACGRATGRPVAATSGTGGAGRAAGVVQR